MRNFAVTFVERAPAIRVQESGCSAPVEKADKRLPASMFMPHVPSP